MVIGMVNIYLCHINICILNGLLNDLFYSFILYFLIPWKVFSHLCSTSALPYQSSNFQSDCGTVEHDHGGKHFLCILPNKQQRL